VIIFGLVWFLSKKVIKLNFFKKKLKPVWLGFFSGFFLFNFGSVWFFRFQAYKTEPIGFFKILIGLISFFSRFDFFGYFFSDFLGLISFFSIFTHSYFLCDIFFNYWIEIVMGCSC